MPLTDNEIDMRIAHSWMRVLTMWNPQDGDNLSWAVAELRRAIEDEVDFLKGLK